MIERSWKRLDWPYGQRLPDISVHRSAKHMLPTSDT